MRSRSYNARVKWPTSRKPHNKLFLMRQGISFAVFDHGYVGELIVALQSVLGSPA